MSTSSTISFSGLASGIDTKSIVSQLMTLERQPEVLLNNQKSTLQSQVDVFSMLNTSLTNMKGLVAGMNTPATFESRTASVGDSTVMSATASSSAAAGTHTVVVTSLAKFQQQVSSGYASSTDLNFKTGSITINGGASPVAINITEGNNSLSGIAAAINSSAANLTASIINDGSGSPYRLVVTAKDTTNYTIDTSGLTTAPAAPNGAAYVNPAFPQSGPTYSAGSNASFSVDGVAITKSSNTVSDVLTGVTLNLLKEGGATSTVTIANDNSGVIAKINNFISSYNDAIGIISKQSVYDPIAKKAGVLSGDSTLRGVKSELQDMISSPVSGLSGKYTMLADLGIATNQTDGTLSITDQSKLDDALNNNYEAVSNIFTANSGVPDLSSDQYGIAERLNQQLNSLTHAFISKDSTDNGVIPSRIQSLKDHMSSIDDQVANMETLMTQKEQSLNTQFTAMETLLSTMQSSGNALIAALANFSTKMA